MRFSKKRRQPGIQQHQEKEGDNRNHIGDGKHVVEPLRSPLSIDVPRSVSASTASGSKCTTAAASRTPPANALPTDMIRPLILNDDKIIGARPPANATKKRTKAKRIL